jgi:hypothetical protein
MVESISEELGMQQIMGSWCLPPGEHMDLADLLGFHQREMVEMDRIISNPPFSPLSSISEKDPIIRERAPVAKLDVPAAAMVQLENRCFGNKMVVGCHTFRKLNLPIAERGFYSSLNA